MGVYWDAYRVLAQSRHLVSSVRQDGVALLIDGFMEELGGRPSVFEAFRDRPKFGVYLYGSVGSGKTMLMDLAGQVNTGKRVERVHFLRFMQTLRLNTRSRPIGHVLTAYTSNTLLLLDELQVNDIADAMILRNILSELDRRGVRLMCTSNRHPDELYLDGIQRASFMPCIAYIHTRMHIWSLSTKDHRPGIGSASHVQNCFFSPIDTKSHQRVRLVMLLECGISELFNPQEGWLEEACACNRAISRLHEMQYW